MKNDNNNKDNRTIKQIKQVKYFKKTYESTSHCHLLK